jgi:hypothetical protein
MTFRVNFARMDDLKISYEKGFVLSVTLTEIVS